jgi:glycosyltransferase involved in cell wall biosynthesis
MTRPINIAFPPIGGDSWMGGQNYLGNLIEQILEFCPDRIQPYLFVDPEYAPALMGHLESKGAFIIRDAYFSKSNQPRRMLRSLALGSDNRALSYYRKHRIDCLFESASYHGWRFPIPALSWIPDFQHRYMPELFTKKAYWRREAGFQISMMGKSHIMLSSEAALKDLRQFYPRARAQTYVVPFAVPAPQRPSPDLLSQVMAEHQLPEKWIFLPNQFWQHKNHIVVIEALAIAVKSNPNICIVCTGATSDPRSPEHFSGLMKNVADYGLNDNFRVLGLVPYAHVGVLLQNAIALLNPSKFEGWSTVVEEAKAAGKQLILSDLPVHREQAGENARYFGVNAADELAEHLVAFFSASNEDVFVRPPSGTCRKFAENFGAAIEKVVQYSC